MHGRSANLIQSLLRHNLVDEYRLWVFPVVIGRQAPVRGRRQALGAAARRQQGLLHRRRHGDLEPAGEPVTGTF